MRTSKMWSRIKTYRRVFENQNDGSLNAYRKFFPLPLLLDKLKLPVQLLVIIAWFVYYGITFIINLIDGTALSPDVLRWLYSHVGNAKFSKIFYLSPGASPDLVPVIYDNTHTIFSFFLLTISIPLGVSVLRSINRGFKDIWEEGVFTVSQGAKELFLKDFQSRINRPIYTVFACLMGLIMWATFIYMSHVNDLTYWWGNSQYGMAGYYLGLVMGFLTYIAIKLLSILYESILAISRIMTFPITPHPFHPDKCSGFSILGNIIRSVYWMILWGGVVIFTVYYMGYFSLENTPTFLLVIAIYTIVLPTAWVTPTWIVVKKLQTEKSNLLTTLEKLMQQNYQTIRLNVSMNNIDKEMDNHVAEIERLQKTYQIIDTMPTWPFQIQRIQTIVVGNIVQIGVFVFTVMAYFKI